MLGKDTVHIQFDGYQEIVDQSLLVITFPHSLASVFCLTTKQNCVNILVRDMMIVLKQS